MCGAIVGTAPLLPAKNPAIPINLRKVSTKYIPLVLCELQSQPVYMSRVAWLAGRAECERESHLMIRITMYAE